jgi:hypothetical protein
LLSCNNSCLSLIAAGGYKNRVPVVSYWRLDNDGTDFPNDHNIDIRLEDIAYHTAMDEQRRLLFVADEERIKSFAWASPSEQASGEGHGHSGLPVHTMNSSGFKGPMHIANGYLFRAGLGSTAVWKIESLENHGPEGRTRIGKRISVGDVWRDDPENIECSSGSALSQKIPFDDPGLHPGRWHPHPSEPSTMLCVSDIHKIQKYACVTVKLGTGQTTDCYLGHSAEVVDISTSKADPNVFVTACNDGYARLYDTRRHLPVMTFDVGQQGDVCPAAIICHPDGIPSAFSADRLLTI